jgi:hypothetical protein
MKDSDKYDVNKAPVSGPFAGLDPAQPPVIVDKQGQRVQVGTAEQAAEAAARNPDSLVNALMTLCSTHVVQIEAGSGNKPTHRIVMGDDGPSFREQLALALSGALAHHAEK